MKDRTARTLRIVSSIAGGTLLIISILMHWLGLSPGSGLGEGNILLMSLAALLLAGAAAGKRIIQLWRILGHTVLVIIIAYMLHGIANAFMTASREPVRDTERSTVQDLRQGILLEAESELEYRPHVLWSVPGLPERFSPVTPDNLSGVWIYGASPMQPASSADMLARSIIARLEERIVDRRQPFYNSTQSLVLLMMDLRENSSPDTVFLIAGRVDVLAALDTGDPRWPAGSSEFSELLGRNENISMNLDGEELASATAEVQWVNGRVLQALGNEYGFEGVFVWTFDSRGVDSISTPLEAELGMNVGFFIREQNECYSAIRDTTAIPPYSEIEFSI